MNTYVTGTVIRQLRERCGMTQTELARQIGVTDKAISRWETARGLPDISLLQPLAQALGVSVMELLAGRPIVNRNTSANLLRAKFYVCPVCGNVIHSIGAAALSCCGIPLPALEGDPVDDAHPFTLEQAEDEQFLTIHHPMTKEHYISFAAFETGDRLQLVKFYPESNPQTRLQLRGHGKLYFYCSRHGLFQKRI